MRHLLLALALLLTLTTTAAAADERYPADHSRVTYRGSYTLAASEALVAPDESRGVTVTVTPHDGTTIDLVVIQVLLTSAIAVPPEHAASCEQPFDERGGRRHTMTCVFLEVVTPLAITFDIPPARITARPPSAACDRTWYIGTPVSVHESGGEVFYQLRVWSPYRPGYCAYAPAVTR